MQSNHNCSLDLGQSLCWVSGVKHQKLFGSLMSLRQLNGLKWDLKKLYSWLYHFITNLFSWLMPSWEEFYIQVEKNSKSSCLWTRPTGVKDRYLPLPYYNLTEVHSEKAPKNKSEVSCTYRRSNYNFTSICFFSFKTKQQDMIV